MANADIGDLKTWVNPGMVVIILPSYNDIVVTRAFVTEHITTTKNNKTNLDMRKFIFFSVIACGVMLAECSDNKQGKAVVNDGDSIVIENTAVEEPTNEEVQVSKGVDLGLSVNWAESNVGAEFPYDTGYEIPYGNTSGSIYYPADVPANISGTEYDIAKTMMGDGWRMPTETEMLELISQCTMTVDTQEGVSGLRITATNGNSIFLPACGSGINAFWDDEENNRKYRTAEPKTVGVMGGYWTGSECAEGRKQIEAARMAACPAVVKDKKA